MTGLGVNSDICLNRLFFLPSKKKIDRSCPFFVIEFVCKTLGIKFNHDTWMDKPDSLINTANDLLEDDISLSSDKVKDHLRDIALFINPDSMTSWSSQEKLLSTFWNIINYTPKIPFKDEESFGYKSEGNPHAIDPIMVYQIAYHYKIPVNRHTELETLQREVMNYSSKLTPLRQNILSRLTSTVMSRNRRGLISLKSYLTDSPTTASITEFPESYPKTFEEAIERAAKDYRWDISLSSDPITEYIELDSVSDDRYTPVDKNWREILNINRKFFHLDFRYISKFEHLYNENTKKGLRYRNGGSLNNDYLVLGLHPMNLSTRNLKTCVTSINMEPIPYDHVDRYRHLISSPDFIVNREELYNLWNTHKVFISPCGLSKCFSDNHLNLIKVNSDPNDKLRILIDNIRDLHKKTIEECLDKSKDNHEKYVKCLLDLLNLGLTIRGYQVCYDRYPLNESMYDIEKYQDDIESKTVCKTIAIRGEYHEEIGNIPVLTGRNVLGKSSDEYNITIYNPDLKISNILDRILTPESFDGCIRTNSNYLLITSWYLLNKIQEISPFDISELRMIS